MLAASPEPWTPERAASLAGRACATAGLSAAGLEPVRFASNAVFALRGERLALRLRRPGTGRAAIERQVALAGWLADAGAPLNRPAAGLAVVDRDLGGAVASFWEWVDHDPAERVGPERLASLLRQLHRVADGYPGTAELPRWDALGRTEGRVEMLERARADWPSTTQLSQLRRLCATTAAALAAIEPQLPPGLIHGDAYAGNVLIDSGSGEASIIDLDDVAQGPREWDLVPTAVSLLRVRGEPAAIPAFTGAYGFDLLSWAGWPAMRRLRELVTTGWLFTVANTAARREEADLRLASLVAGDEGARWHRV